MLLDFHYSNKIPEVIKLKKRKKFILTPSFGSFSMANCQIAFGLVMEQYITARNASRVSSSPHGGQGVKREREEESVVPYPLYGFIPNDLTFH
jgi:hypothetical protein